jgi:hypothetical protein
VYYNLWERRMPVEISIGRTVHYKLSEGDVQRIQAARKDAPNHAETGFQKHQGNPVAVGDEVPMVVVRVWPDEFGPGKVGVNGQAFLDGNDSLWVCSAQEGTEPGQWHWPERV